MGRARWEEWSHLFWHPGGGLYIPRHLSCRADKPPYPIPVVLSRGQPLPWSLQYGGSVGSPLAGSCPHSASRTALRPRRDTALQ